MLRAVYALSGRDCDLFAVRAFSHPRASTTRRAGRFSPTWAAPPTPSSSTSSRATTPSSRKSSPATTSRFSVHVEGVRPPKGLAALQRRRRQVFRHSRDFIPGGQMYDPWQVTLTNVQQSMDYYLTGGDAESLHYHLEVLPAPTITSIALDLEFPQVHQCPAADRRRGGKRRGDRGDRRHRSRHDQHAGEPGDARHRQ